MMAPSSRSLASWLALAAGLLAGAGLVWFVGPVLAVRGWYPLEGMAARAGVIVALLLVPLMSALWRQLRARRLARRALQQADDVDTVVDLALLRLRARPADAPTGWRAAWAGLRQAHPPDPLAALPWVLVVGTPGSDKRRALAAAGFDLPVRQAAEPPCTWCITPQVVLIDVAEDLLTERHADWLRLLRRLQQARPLQPVSAVLVLLQAADRGGQALADLGSQVSLVQGRLLDLIRICGLFPPVHLAITGCDRLEGFPAPDAEQRLQEAAVQLHPSERDRRPVALLGRDPAALRRAIDTQVLAPRAQVPHAGGFLQRRRWLVRGGYAATVLLCAGLATGWMASRQQNLDLIARQDKALAPIKAALDTAAPALARSDVAPLLPALAQVQLAAKDAGQANWAARLGLFQGDKLQALAEQAYERLLRQGLAPILLARLEIRLRDAVALGESADDSLYDLLRLYLALQPPGSGTPFFIPSAQITAAVGLLDLPASEQKAMQLHVTALLAGRGLPGLSVEPALVSQVRQLLASRPLDRLLYRQMSGRFSQAGQPELGLNELVGPGGDVLFNRRSGRPPSDGMPTLFTLEGIDRFVVPVLKAGVLDDIRRVLGQAVASPGEPDPADATVYAAALQRYQRDYITAWDDLLADLHLLPLQRLVLRNGLVKQLATPESPVAVLLQTAALQTTPGRKLAALAPTGINTMQVDEHFAALHDLVLREPSPLAKGLSQLADLVQASESTSIDELRPAINALPQPLRQMLHSTDSGLGPTSSQADAAGAYIVLLQQCQRSATDRYPLAAQAKAEMTPAEFAALFGPGTGFDAYFQRWLVPLVDTSRRPWLWKPGAFTQTPVPAAALDSFQRAALLRDTFFRTGGPLPSLTVGVAIGSLDATIAAAELRLNDRPTALRPGQAPVTLAWPGQPALQRLSLGAAGAKQPDLAFTGDWTLLRLLDALTLQPTRAPERYVAKLAIGGRPAELTVTLASALGLGKADLRQFRCPPAGAAAARAEPDQAAPNQAAPKLAGKKAAS